MSVVPTESGSIVASLNKPLLSISDVKLLSSGSNVCVGFFLLVFVLLFVHHLRLHGALL